MEHHLTLLLQVIGSHLVALDEGLRQRAKAQNGKKIVGSPTAEELELASQVVKHLSTISREVSVSSVKFTAEQKRILRSQITAYRLLAQDVVLDTILLAGVTNTISRDPIELFRSTSSEGRDKEAVSKLATSTNVEISDMSSSECVSSGVCDRKRKRKRTQVLEEPHQQRKALHQLDNHLDNHNSSDVESDGYESEWTDIDDELETSRPSAMELLYEVVPDSSRNVPVSRPASAVSTSSASSSTSPSSSSSPVFPHMIGTVDIDSRLERVVHMDPDARDHVTTLDETRATLREQRQILTKQCSQLKGEIVEARIVAERAETIVHQKAEMLKLRQQQHRQLEHCLATLEAARAHVANNLQQKMHRDTQKEDAQFLLPQDVQNAAETRCCICLDKPRAIAYIPCGHMCVCRSCHRPPSCPICRSHSTSFLRIFN